MSYKTVFGKLVKIAPAPYKQWGRPRIQSPARGAPEPKLVKGAFGGLCNRSACLAPGANWWNSGSRSHYCEECAHMLNAANRDYMGGLDMCRKVFSEMITVDSLSSISQERN